MNKITAEQALEAMVALGMVVKVTGLCAHCCYANMILYVPTPEYMQRAAPDFRAGACLGCLVLNAATNGRTFG